MTVRKFCGPTTDASIVNPATGSWLTGDSGTVWSDMTSGTQYRDLKDAAGLSIPRGIVQSLLPGYCQEFWIDADPVVETVWLDFGGDVRVRVECNDRASYRVDVSDINQPNGVAGLDSAGRLAVKVPFDGIEGYTPGVGYVIGFAEDPNDPGFFIPAFDGNNGGGGGGDVVGFIEDPNDPGYFIPATSNGNGTIVDLSNYYTRAQVNDLLSSALQAYYTRAQVDAAIAAAIAAYDASKQQQPPTDTTALYGTGVYGVNTYN